MRMAFVARLVQPIVRELVQDCVSCTTSRRRDSDVRTDAGFLTWASSIFLDGTMAAGAARVMKAATKMVMVSFIFTFSFW